MSVPSVSHAQAHRSRRRSTGDSRSEFSDTNFASQLRDAFVPIWGALGGVSSGLADLEGLMGSKDDKPSALVAAQLIPLAWAI
jgi:hypothetical protein